MAVIILSTCIVSLILSNASLSVSNYTIIVPSFTRAVRIVHLTDLHNSEFGHENNRLVRKVAQQAPDLILITGDLLNQNDEQTDVAETLIRSLHEIAPVYVSYGNHELAYERTFGADLRQTYTDSGATVLEYNWEELVVNGQAIRLGGVYGYCLPKEYERTGEARKDECDYLQKFQDTKDYTILMCHMPVSWIRYGSLESWSVDCVLSGHDHGGQIRVPAIGGLWAPDQGWFPGKECGIYWSEDGKRAMVLSRGLGNTDWVPRMNNVPEVLVLELVPERVLLSR